MNKEQLKALGLNDEQITEVFKLNGKAIAKEQQRADSTEIALEDTKKMLTDANAKIEGFKDLDIDTIKAEAQKYKDELETTRRESEDRINALQYETTLKEYMGNHKFASERIKNSIMNDVKSKEFKMDDGKLLGVDEYMNQLKEKEPESFAIVDSTDTPNFLRPGATKIPKEESKSLSIADLAREASIRK